MTFYKLQEMVAMVLGRLQIMYSAFISYNQIKEYLTILIDKDLLHYDWSIQKFRIAEKGLSLMQLCDKLGDLIEETTINSHSG